jgi:hypothetical protein
MNEMLRVPAAHSREGRGLYNVQSGEGARCPIGGGPAALNPTRRCTGNDFTFLVGDSHLLFGQLK